MVSKKNKSLLVFLILGFIFTLLFFNYLYSINRIGSGVYFKNVYLGGKSLQEVEEILNTSHFNIVGPDGESISIPLREIGVKLDNKQIFDTAYQLSPGKLWLQHYIPKEKVFVPFQYQFDKELLAKSVNSLVKHFSKEPENSYFRVSSNNQVEIMPEKFGYRFNKNDIEQVIMENLAQSSRPLEIKIPFAKKIPPQITVSSLKEKGIEGPMISFTTKFDATLTTRVHNIKLAAATINNYVLAPGDVFSFNSIIGNTTTEKGYKAANVIIGGELVPGIGGGLCQISSTLYNCALLSNLKILERHNHQLTVPYIDPGRDATVCYPSKDLSFCNTKDHYILVTASVENDELTIRFFGQPLNEKVEIKTKVLETYPPPQKSDPGKQEDIKGYPGYLIEVWKIVYQDEKKLKEDKISIDKYAPFQMTPH